MPSWEEMCKQIVIDGRPGDVASAALGWEQLLKNLRTVKESLETNVKDLGDAWKGPAYEAFKTHITGLAKRAGQLVEDAESQNGIVRSLNEAADKLTAAQREFPIPASCVNDVLEARNGRLVIDTGFFEMKVKPDFLGFLDPITSLADWINDKSEEAAKVYNQVRGDYTTVDSRTPGESGPFTSTDPKVTTPDLGGGPGAGKTGGVPSLGGSPSTGGIGGSPSLSTSGMPDTGSPGIGSGAHPDLSGGYGSGGGGYPGSGSLADDYGSGLAGAGGGGAPGLGGGGFGGGLPATSGLGAGGGMGGGGAGLAGSGMIPGGGALGRPVTAGMPPMMGGGGAAGAGRGGGRGGRLAGGMAPAMGGGMAGGARGGGRGGAAGAAGAGARGAGVRGGGVAGMGGAGGAGYGEEEAPRNSWLEEDEDVWGADGDGTPGVLR